MKGSYEEKEAGPENVLPETLRLGFLTLVHWDEDQSYRGAVLVTDAQGKPLEFRCTDPVRPNAVQRTLYGKTLVPYIAQELVARPLVSALSERTDLLITDNAQVLDGRPKLGVPVIHIRRQGETISSGASHAEGGEDPREELLPCESAKFAPLIVKSHWTVPEEAQSARLLLQSVFPVVDLLEPFERVRNALEEIRQHEEKKR